MTTPTEKTAGIFRINLLRDRIVYLSVEAGSIIQLEDAKQARDSVREFARELKVTPILLIYDMEGTKKIEKEARSYLTNLPEPLTKACSVLVGSTLSRMLGNFLIGLNKPPFPAKLFTNKEKAADWLLQYR